MRIYNTLSAQKEEFQPQSDEVKIYVCGVTPYDESHLGHAMNAVIFDTIRRYLIFRGYKVKYVQNITDIEDKIIDRADKLGIAPRELAEKYTQRYFEDMAALNVLHPDIAPCATEEIPKMLEVISGLVEKRHAYPANGSVYFRVRSMSDYGKLSKRTLDSMMAGARIEPSEEKEHPMDFALWKAAKPGEPTWDSPWGKGRPGWHIECSAMSLKYLGETIDIHGGGQDLIFPHHENEIAQSECFTGKKPFARYWMHNGLFQLGEEKMSKSLGNMVSIKQVLAKHSADGFRLFILGSHYRNPLTLSEEAIKAAERGMERLTQALGSEFIQSKVTAEKLDTQSFQQRFIDVMDDDFNTPQALAVLFELARQINQGRDNNYDVTEYQNTLRTLAGVLGLTLKEPKLIAIDTNQLLEVGVLVGQSNVAESRKEAIQRAIERIRSAAEGSFELTEVQGLINLLKGVRETARKKRDFDLADRIRRGLDSAGVTLEDGPQGTTWKWKR
ncbi:MAG: cysteine--tRNA ligase [Chloroflexi bacterium]|nr:cysteine--tRNA ligase [Chloroflexota bacterium]